MRRTRFMSLVFLALSAALLGSQDFRWALQAPVWEYRFIEFNRAFVATFDDKNAPEPHPLAILPPQKVQQLTQQADQGDAAAGAFLALNLPSEQRSEKLRLAEQAVNRDPNLYWVLALLSLQSQQAVRDPELAPRIAAWLERVEKADPENAFPHILRAEFVRQQTPGFPSSVNWKDDAQQKFLLKQSDWLAAYDQAYRAPRYNSYQIDWFRLNRTVLAERGWESPWMLVAHGTSYTLPNLMSARSYTNLQVLYLAHKDEKSGQTESAIRRYYLASNFGRRLQQDGNVLIERLIGIAFEKIAGPPLAAALNKAGHHEEAAGVRLRFEPDTGKLLRDPLIQSTNRPWATLLMHMFFAGVVTFGSLSVITLMYTGAKFVFRREHRGGLDNFMAVLGNYSAILLLICCFGLLITYAPYAQNFRSYLRATENLHDLEFVLPNSIPMQDVHFGEPPLPNPFVGYAAWAALGGILVLVLTALDAVEASPRRHRGLGAQGRKM